MTQRPEQIEFFFDPMCPWAYQTSLWIREVRDLTGVSIVWRFFSLEEINRREGKKHPWEREWSYGWSQMRIGALLRRRSQADLDTWYRAVGRSFHEHGIRTQDPVVHRGILDDLGFGGAVLDEAIADPTTSDEVRADHQEVTATHGAFGVPVIVLPGGEAVYGPVTVPPPTGDDAVRLWDLTLDFARFPGVFELKRPKTVDDLRMIARVFEPYLRARDWQTIENPAP